ncbi:MAG TPA: UPF0182 family protein [Acidimicrobiia bacterium]|nr:UPF0182 family protein [Acidimicrobiia bacterium]
MRVPTVEPRRRSRFRLRGWIIGIVVVLIILLFSLRGLAGFYTDYLWFDSLGQGTTWSSLLAARVAPALVFTVVFFVIMFVNLVIADRLAPKYRAMGPEDELIARYQQVAGPYTMRIRIGVSLFFALIAGIGVSSQWKQWILFTHYQSFHRVDPQFHKDIGFYVFQLPFLKFIAEWLFAGLVIVLIVTAVEHYLNGGIRFQSPFQRVTPQVKAHLSVILAVMALVKTAQYYLGRFELNFSTRGVVEGASATDVKAQLPALNLLIFISIVAAALFLWNIRRRGWVLPIIAVGLWAFVSLVIGTIYPAAYQQFKVGPNEYQAESKYIDRNIRATRDAFGLDAVKADNFNFTSLQSGKGGMTTEEAQTLVDTNTGTIDNARLWDPNVIHDTYNTLQNLQTYYQIGDVDIDRYMIDGRVQQVLIAARGLNSADLPSQSFVNRHIVYTHGYGAVASPSNSAEVGGDPNFYLRNVPVEDTGIKMDSGPPSQIYFAENLGSYVLTGAKQAEFNYQRQGATDQFTRYKGKDGVKLSNFVRRAAFALRFGSLDPLISGQINSDTKLLMERDIRARVTKLAPFLQFDADPYPVVLGNRTLWIMDGYTTTDMYPYGQSLGGEGSLSGGFNYVRNSVKVTVDAYQGTVTFYVFDQKDPIIQAYESAFPDLFTPASQMPDDIRAHLRYPEDLFKSQSAMFGRYHVTEPKRFYDGSSKWLVSPDPGSGRVSSDLLSEATAAAGSASSSNSNQPQAATSTGARISPYYLNIRLPGQTEEHFILTVPFVPVSSGNSQTRLVSFLTADSDPRQYGHMNAFTMPTGQTVLGPVQVNNQIIRTPAVSTAITLLNQQGSQIIQGSMQLIPVGNSLIYVRPFYAQSRGQGSYPLFQFVVVFSQDKGAFCGPTVQDALNQMVERETASVQCNVSGVLPGVNTGNNTTTTTTTPGGTATTTPTTTPAPSTTTIPPATGSVQDLLNQAAAKLDQAQQALQNQDLGTYQKLVGEARTLVKQAQQKQGGG